MEHELYRRSFGDASFEVGFFFLGGAHLKVAGFVCVFFLLPFLP